MRLFYIFSFVLLTLSSKAQITINFADFGVAGDTLYFAKDTTLASSVNVGTSGANQTWSFSSAVSADVYDTCIFYAPSFDPNAPSGTTHIIRFAGSTNYLDVTTSAIKGIFDQPTFGITGTRLKTLEFPTTYQTTFADSTSATVVGLPSDFGFPSGLFDSIKIVAHVYANSNCDGWGSLVTPTSSYNALRVKFVTRQIAFVYGKGTLTGGAWSNVANQDQSDTVYNWFGQGSKYHLAQATIDSGKVSRFVYRVPSIPVSTGISNAMNHTEDLMMYPNPANSILTIKMPENNRTNIHIYNIRGQLVKSLENEPVSNGIVSISLSDLNEGVYMATAVNNGYTTAKKFLIAR